MRPATYLRRYLSIIYGVCRTVCDKIYLIFLFIIIENVMFEDLLLRLCAPRDGKIEDEPG